MEPVKPLKIDKWLGKAINRIYRVGIELEGGWLKLPQGVNLTHDGSVRIDPPAPPIAPAMTADELRNAQRTGQWPERVRTEMQAYEQAVRGTKLFTGELPSEPLEPSKFPTWMVAYYPSKVNATCGLHVHQSFKSAYHYQRLMVPEYQSTMVEYLGQWADAEKLPKKHPIWDRLSGKSEFCKLEFCADMQAAKGKKDFDHHAPGNRYSAIHYAWLMHGTIECRVLPMMDTSDLGIRAVQRVLDITNACLVLLAKPEYKQKAEVYAKDALILREEKREYV